MKKDEDLLCAWPGMAKMQAKQTRRPLHVCLVDFPPTHGKIMQVERVVVDGRVVYLRKPSRFGWVS